METQHAVQEMSRIRDHGLSVLASRVSWTSSVHGVKAATADDVPPITTVKAATPDNIPEPPGSKNTIWERARA